MKKLANKEHWKPVAQCRMCKAVKMEEKEIDKIKVIRCVVVFSVRQITCRNCRAKIQAQIDLFTAYPPYHL